MRMGVVVVAATLWGLGSLSLILPVLHASSVLSRTAAALLGLEFLMLLLWSYGAESCQGACPAATSLAHAVAFQDIPALSLVLVACGAIEGRRAWRGARVR